MRERGLLKLGDHFTEKYFVNVKDGNRHAELSQVGFPLPVSAESFESFQKSPDGLLFRVGCYKLLIQVLHFINENRRHYHAFIQHFMTEHICRDGTDVGYNQSNIVLYQQGMICLAKIVSLLGNEIIPVDARMNAAKNLLTDITVCGPGSYTNIVNTYLGLQAYLGLQFELKQFRTHVAQAVMMDVMRYAKLNISVGMEIHYANAVINYYADSLAIDSIEDAFENFCNQDYLTVLKHIFRMRITNYLIASKQIDSMIENMRVDEFVKKLGKFMSEGENLAYNDAISDFMANLKQYGVDEFNVAKLFVMSEDMTAITCASYAGSVALFAAIARGLEKIGYLNPLDTANLSQCPPLGVMVAPGMSLRFAKIIKGEETALLLPYFLDKLLENHEEWVFIYRSLYPVKSYLDELDIYVARYFATADYHQLEMQDKELVLLDFLHVRGVDRWFDISTVLPADLAKKHLSRLLRLHISLPVIHEICDYYFNHSKRRDFLLVEYFMDKFDRSETNDDTGVTLLHEIAAIDFPDAALMTELIKRGFAVDAQDERGSTPLIYACYDSAIHSVAALLMHHADVNIRDEDGSTALHFACMGNDASIVHMLLQHGANADIFNKSGYLPLHLACRFGNEAIVSLFLSEDTLLMDMVAHDGESPLSLAIQYNHWGIVRTLLLKGASTQWLQKHHVHSLMAMFEAHDYPEMVVPVLRNLVAEYQINIVKKLNSVRPTDLNVVDARRAEANTTWNARRYFRSAKSHAIQRLLSMLDGKDWQVVDDPKKAMDKVYWDLALMTSRRMTLFVDTYQALQKKGMVLDPDPAFDLNLHI